MGGAEVQARQGSQESDEIEHAAVRGQERRAGVAGKDSHQKA